MFKIERKIGKARIGKLKTNHGVISTPFFMPDATRGFVRSLGKDDLKNLGIGPMVINTYHLYLQPGLDIIIGACGAHSFMNWERPLLSDSGGYQVFSLIHKNPKLGQITDDAVIFKSPLDGSIHKLTPEKSIEIQFDLGVDMMVVLDDPPPNTYPKVKIAEAVERTIRWAERCMVEYKKQLKIRKIENEKRPLIFCVIQGGPYIDLRKRCTEELVKIGFDGYGFGARHIDQEGNVMEEVLRETANFIPEKALRFALGVGKPEDIIKCHSYGWDMFDCVIPTREGRHGRLFLQKGGTININNGKFKSDFSKIDENCDCELCKNHTRAYLHHIFSLKEPLAMRLASIHNLKVYIDLMKNLR